MEKFKNYTTVKVIQSLYYHIPQRVLAHCLSGIGVVIFQVYLALQTLTPDAPHKVHFCFSVCVCLSLCLLPPFLLLSLFSNLVIYLESFHSKNCFQYYPSMTDTFYGS